jgi:hypothetical protein
MRDLLERGSFEALDVAVDERLARAELRRQVGRLERQLAALFAEAFGRVEIDHRVQALSAAPRVLDLGGLERMRDELAERVATAREQLARRAEVEAANRELLQALIASPADYKWVWISRADVGEPGCGGWHSRPRLGPIGMLMGWWRVKVSSGCPLAGRLAAVEQEAQAARQTPAAPASARSGGAAVHPARARGPRRSDCRAPTPSLP